MFFFCFQSRRAYRETYRLVRCSPAITEQEFSFSETHVFGRFDLFCARIRKLLTMYDLIEDYQQLFKRRMEGLLLGEGSLFFQLSALSATIQYVTARLLIYLLGFCSRTALDEAVEVFEEANKIATSKSYDYLDPRNNEFDRDYDVFITKTNELKQHIGNIIERNYLDVWETPQGIKFLTRFEKVGFISKRLNFILYYNERFDESIFF